LRGCLDDLFSARRLAINVFEASNAGFAIDPSSIVSDGIGGGVSLAHANAAWVAPALA
jgi:hypothetical protein